MILTSYYNIINILSHLKQKHFWGMYNLSGYHLTYSKWDLSWHDIWSATLYDRNVGENLFADDSQLPQAPIKFSEDLGPHSNNQSKKIVS